MMLDRFPSALSELSASNSQLLGELGLGSGSDQDSRLPGPVGVSDVEFEYGSRPEFRHSVEEPLRQLRPSWDAGTLGGEYI